MFKGESKTEPFQLNENGLVALDDTLHLYSKAVNKAIETYIKFNESDILNREDLHLYDDMLSSIGEHLRVASVALDKLGDGLNITDKQLSQGLDQWGIEIGIKTPTLFDETEDVIDKLTSFSNVYRTKFLLRYITNVERYATIIYKGEVIKKSALLNSNASLISSVIYNSTTGLRDKFLSKENGKYKLFRELCILHFILISELQQTRKIIGW